MAPMIRRLNLLQIDSVNVVARSHYLPLFSRLGAYPQAALDERAFGQPRGALGVAQAEKLANLDGRVVCRHQE